MVKERSVFEPQSSIATTSRCNRAVGVCERLDALQYLYLF